MTAPRLVCCGGCDGGRWGDRPCNTCGWTVDRIVPTAEADRVADDVLGEPVDSHVSRAYSAPARQFDAGSEALELCRSGLSARDAVDSVRVRFELDDSETFRVCREVEFALRREERGR